MNYPYVSIIIPTFNDSKRLDKCLNSIKNLDYLEEKFEVIVADNGSTDNTKEIVEKYNFRYIFVKRPSSYIARNNAIKIARYEIIAFTDSDCLIEKNWLRNGVRSLMSSKNIGIVGGNIKLFFKDPNNLTFVEVYEKYFAFNQKNNVDVHKYSVTANAFTFKSLLKKVGFFREDLVSGGDNYFGKTVYNIGYHILYCPDAIIYHPARYSFKNIYNNYMRTSSGIFELFMKKHKNVLWYIIKDSIRSSRLPIQQIHYLIFKRKATLSETLKAFTVIMFTRYIRSAELFRLYFGTKHKNT